MKAFPKQGCGCLAQTTNPAGFTLVELLVVLAGLGLLAALGFSGLRQAIGSSQTGRCAANLRTMAQAVLAYSADEGGKIPPAMVLADPAETDGTGHRLWIDYLQPYLPALTGQENQHPYLCPAARRPGMWTNRCPDYGCNSRWSDAENVGAFALQSWNPEPYPAEVRAVRIQNPSQLVMFADSYSSNNVYENGRWALDLRPLTQGGGAGQLLAGGIAPRHQVHSDSGLGRFNVVFFDGHVESVDVRDPRLQDPATCRRWISLE